MKNKLGENLIWHKKFQMQDSKLNCYKISLNLDKIVRALVKEMYGKGGHILIF